MTVKVQAGVTPPSRDCPKRPDCYGHTLRPRTLGTQSAQRSAPNGSQALGCRFESCRARSGPVDGGTRSRSSWESPLPRGPAQTAVQVPGLPRPRPALFRRELRLAGGLLRSVPGDDVRRAAVVADHLRLVEEVLHHHSSEDHLLWPLLVERVTEELTPVVRLVEAQHEQVDFLLGQIAVDRPIWSQDPTAAPHERLADPTTGSTPAWPGTPTTREARVLPLVAHCVTEDEWAALGEAGRSGIPRRHLSLVFGMLVYDGDAAVITRMLAPPPPPPPPPLPLPVRCWSRGWAAGRTAGTPSRCTARRRRDHPGASRPSRGAPRGHQPVPAPTRTRRPDSPPRGRRRDRSAPPPPPRTAPAAFTPSQGDTARRSSGPVPALVAACKCGRSAPQAVGGTVFPSTRGRTRDRSRSPT